MLIRRAGTLFFLAIENFDVGKLLVGDAKNPDVTVREYVDSVAKQLGGSIKVAGFERFALGQAAE